MIAGLVRHHPLFKGVPKLMAVGAVTSVLVANILTFWLLYNRQETSAPAGFLLGLQLVFSLTAASMLFRGANLRTSSWHLGMPLTADSLWRSHYLALLAGMFFLLVFQGLVVGVFFQLLFILTGRLIFPLEELALAFLRPALVLIFLAGMTAAFRVELADLAQSARWRNYRLQLLGAAVAILVLLYFLPPVVGLLPAGWGALAAARGRRRLPPSLNLGNGTGRERAADAGEHWQHLAVAPEIYRGNSPLVSLSVLNQLFKIPYPWVFLFSLFVAFFGALMAGYPIYQSHNFLEIIRLNNFFLTVYLLFSLTGEFVLRLYKVDALPVSRRSLLRYLVVPGLVALLAGYGGARLWIEMRHVPVELVSFQDRFGKYGASVAPSFNRVMRRGETLEVAAPWGETHSAEARHPVPFYPSPLASNSPYLTEGETSREFLAWQLSRAVEEVYGVWIEPAELDNRYITVGPDSCCLVSRGGFTVAKDYNLKPRSGGPVGALILGPLFGFWFLVMGFYFRLLQVGRSVKWARTTWWVLMAALFGLHILQTLNFLPMYNPLSSAVLIFASARALGGLGPVGWLAGYGAAVLLIFFAWRFCSRMFLMVQAPRP